jgi:hypothetical protein
MAAQNTFLYNNARSMLATGQINWPSCAAHAVLVNAAYAPSLADKFLSDVPSGAIMQDVAMTGLAQSNGVCYGVIPQFDAFLSPSVVVALLIYISNGPASTSPLVYYSADGIGFPFQPLGFNYAVGFDQSAGGFFQA